MYGSVDVDTGSRGVDGHGGHRTRRLVYAGALGAAHAHTHAAVQIAVAVDGVLRFSDGGDGTAQGTAAVIPPASPTHSTRARPGA